jgi:hypothetical protein
MQRYQMDGLEVHLLVITCPKTGKDVETGFAMSKPVFDSIPLTNCRARCGHCGGTHIWSIWDARLQERVDAA